MKLVVSIAFIALTLGFAAQASAQQHVSWSSHTMRIGPDEYRREGAPGVTIGSFGVAPAAITAHWQQQSFIPGPLDAVQTTMGVPTSTLQRGFNIQGSGQIPVANITLPAQLQAQIESRIDQHYNLLIITMQRPLEALNAARAEAARIGYPHLVEDRDFRIITATVSVFGYRSDETLTGAGATQVRVPGLSSDTVAISAGYSRSEHQVTTIDQQTVIGYRFAGVCWEGGAPARVFVDLTHIGRARPQGCKTFEESQRAHR